MRSDTKKRTRKTVQMRFRVIKRPRPAFEGKIKAIFQSGTADERFMALLLQEVLTKKPETGQEILQGIRDEVAKIKLNSDEAVLGSLLLGITI